MSFLAQLDRSPLAGEPKEEGPAADARRVDAQRHEDALREREDAEDAAILRASNGALDLADPDVAREEAVEIVASRAEGPPQAAIGRGLFDKHYGPGAMEELMQRSGFTVTRTREQGLSFMFDLVGRDAQGRPDIHGSPVSVHDAGTNVQVKQKPPSAEMLALALAEMARLKNWPSINIESHGPLAAEVRQHLERMGMSVVKVGSAGPQGSLQAPRRQSPGMGMG